MIVRCKGSALWCSIIPTAQAIDIDDEKYQTDLFSGPAGTLILPWNN
ncbi:MAG: hypothetical protein K5884_10470 [Ruminococcus sp.]|nr:hypothetical protein [Ruminococcus sp.]